MNKLFKKTLDHPKIILFACFVFIFLIAWGFFIYTKLNKEKASIDQRLADTRFDLTEALEENLRLNEDLKIARGDIDKYGSQIDDLSSTLEKLKKLAETDEELLKQYSKVYFLNENYVPRGLTEISPLFLFNTNKPQTILVLVYPFLQRLIEDSIEYDLDIKILSAYRSFNEQESLKSSYKITYGANSANSFSADQGYSEHQLGTTVDFTTPKVGDGLSSFSKTKEYEWLLKNAYKYGFILSYSEKNTSYVFEPWHWRFVGVSLATRLREEREEFYTLEQRQIDPYLISLFDS